MVDCTHTSLTHPHTHTHTPHLHHTCITHTTLASHTPHLHHTCITHTTLTPHLHHTSHTHTQHTCITHTTLTPHLHHTSHTHTTLASHITHTTLASHITHTPHLHHTYTTLASHITHTPHLHHTSHTHHTCITHTSHMHTHTRTHHTHSQPSLQDINNHMEQLTQLVERMSARFVILETQLKLVKTHQPGEQRPPPTSLPSFDTQETPSPPHDNRTTKKVTMVEVAPSPPIHQQTSSHSLSPSRLVHIQTSTETPAKMRTLLKSPPLLPPPITSGTLSASCKTVSTPLNTWTVHNPSGDAVNLSFHSAADEQLHRKNQSPICSKSPAKLSSVHQTSGFCFTPTTPVRVLLVVK